MAAKRKTQPQPENVIENYLNASSEHDNTFTLNVFLDAIKSDIFPDTETPLRLFVEIRNALSYLAKHPEKVIPVFEQFTEGLTNGQKLYMAGTVHNYFKRTVFGEEEIFLTNVSKTLAAYIERLEKESGNKAIRPDDLRQTLQELVKKEVANLPTYFEGLTPKERMNVLCKFMPFILSRPEPEKKKLGGSLLDW